MLDPNDLRSPEIGRLREELTARLEARRLKLEADMDPVLTATQRGRIRELKELLALLAPAQARGPLGAPRMEGDLPDFLEPLNHGDHSAS